MEVCKKLHSDPPKRDKYISLSDEQREPLILHPQVPQEVERPPSLWSHSPTDLAPRLCPTVSDNGGTGAIMTATVNSALNGEAYDGLKGECCH